MSLCGMQIAWKAYPQTIFMMAYTNQISIRAAQSYRIIYEIRETAGEVTVHVISIRSKVYDIAYKRLVKP